MMLAAPREIVREDPKFERRIGLPVAVTEIDLLRDDGESKRPYTS